MLMVGRLRIIEELLLLRRPVSCDWFRRVVALEVIEEVAGGWLAIARSVPDFLVAGGADVAGAMVEAVGHCLS
jgi:hypothetical protein